MPIAPASQVGQYRVVRLVGAGGMGVVYQVEESGTGRIWALKTLAHAKEGGELWRRFMNEGQIHSRLEHPGIAAFREMFLFGDQPCIVMEYVDGETVTGCLARLGRLDPAEAARVMAHVCGALTYLHSKGIIHRDLKSSNIKINSAGEVKLLDFGIARAEGGQRMTRIGAVMGTPESLAPELLDGKPAGMRTEIWGLGVLGYEMVTGVMPFQGPTDEALYRAVRSQNPVPPAQLNAAMTVQFEKVLLRCLEKNPAKRYGSTGELKLALSKCTGNATGAVTLTPIRGAVGENAAALFDWARRFSPQGSQALNLQAWAKIWEHPAAKRVAVVVLIGMALLIGIWSLGSNVSSGDNKTVTIEVADGPAEVYENGERIGQTPYRRKARVGEALQLELRRPGYLNQPVQFDVTERKVYSYTMQRASR